MAATSPTRRSLKLLRDQGYSAWVVEYYNFFAKQRIDLFGIIDIVAVGDGKTLGVQTTSDSNVSARVHKIRESPYLQVLVESGWLIVVHGWRKGKNGRWKVREVEINGLF